ncbi:MAG TPA: iron-containing alcohol dehydrogenase [Solirubrobacterales bacterium]|nr:iron-containing alcohol dehydrogenase [Solirubrobacterales bacterium]
MAEVAARSPSPAIVLIGFMAAGKSTAARAIAGRLEWCAFADADEVFEHEHGPIAELFEREGEAEFRRREEELVARLLDPGVEREGPLVVALGGGAVESEGVRAALRGHLCVWCDVDEEVAWARASVDRSRPLAADRTEFSRRFEARRPLYESLARAILPDGGSETGASAAPWLAAMRGLPDTRMIWARTAGGSYPAIVGRGSLGALGAARAATPSALPARTFLIADPAPPADLREGLGEVVAAIEVPGGEASKTMAEAERVLGELARGGARRDDLVVALGGGVVGDLAGFCAATYQRGLPVVQVPTTLVAQVDSAYGGKTGVDLPEAKNYVGAYHQPLAVLTDPAALETLPAEEMAAGFVEVVKTALLAGGELWERVRSLESLDPAGLGDVIFACARTKIGVVAADERDSGRRATLNLGHTVGHAIETAGGYGRYRHGEAVGLGLLAALRLSGAGDLRAEVAELLAGHDLPTRLDPALEVDDVLSAMSRDKKATGAGIGFVLLERPGEPRWGQRVDADRVRASIEELYG